MKLAMKNGVSIEMEVIVRVEKDGFCAERFVALEEMFYDMDGTMDRVVNELYDEIQNREDNHVQH